MSYKIGYCRTSTNQQDLGIQRDALLAAGCDEIHEEQESGAKRNRPILANVISRLRPGDTFVCWKFDRVARSALHLLEIVEGLQACNINFISLTEQMDLSTPIGKAMLTVAAAFAELERGNIQERREAGLKRAREKGVKFGRKSAADPTARVDKSGRLAKAMLAVARGQSLSSAAKEHNIGKATLSRHLAAQKETISEQEFSLRKSMTVSERKERSNGQDASVLDQRSA